MSERNVICPGVWVEDNELHIDGAAYLRHLALPVTKEGVEEAEQAIMDAWRERMNPQARVVRTEYHFPQP